MKILHICAQRPAFSSGGELCVYQSHYALTNLYSEVDYAGPQIKNEEIENKYKKCYYLDSPITKFTKLRTLAHFQFDRAYPNWKNAHIQFDKYDVIYIEFTKMDYVIKDILKSGFKGKIIVRAHNVETDFYRIEYENDRTILRLLKYKFSRSRENYMLQKADRILAITDQDKKTFMDTYELPDEKIVVFPVGVNQDNFESEITGKINEKLNCLITGSLWFGPNSDGAKWFIKQVWPHVKNICTLTLAGSNPSEEIKKLCENENIEIKESPESMVPYFEKADMVLAPVFSGAGMKVKIAEAMSYGLPIVTTEHGAIGYKISNGVDGYICKTPDEFVDAIIRYYNMSEIERCEFLKRERKLYKENYSLNAIKDKVEKIVQEVIVFKGNER